MSNLKPLGEYSPGGFLMDGNAVKELTFEAVCDILTTRMRKAMTKRVSLERFYREASVGDRKVPVAERKQA
jgi:hypothetical protein